MNKNELDNNTKKNEVSCIKDMINSIHITHQITVTNKIFEKEIKGKHVSIKLKYNITPVSVLFNWKILLIIVIIYHTL